MRRSTLMQRWGLFAATVFLLFGLTLAWLQAGPVAGHGAALRYAFWLATAAMTFVSWWLSQWLLVSGRERLSRGLLIASCLLATLLFVPGSLAIDLLFALPETEPSWLALVIDEWLASALPVFASCMIASLPAWLSATEPRDDPNPNPGPEPGPEPGLAAAPDPEPQPGPPPDLESGAPVDAGLLPVAVRGGVLRATADLQYVHLLSPEGVTTVPGPMHRVIGLLGDQGLEVRRGEWIADRHVRQVKSARGRWVVLLRDGQQVAVSRRRVAEVKKRWGSTRYA